MATLQPAPINTPATSDDRLTREWVLFVRALEAKIKELEARIAALEAE